MSMCMLYNIVQGGSERFPNGRISVNIISCELKLRNWNFMKRVIVTTQKYHNWKSNERHHMVMANVSFGKRYSILFKMFTSTLWYVTDKNLHKDLKLSSINGLMNNFYHTELN
jgi:hypothetical protein